jgi:prepilin-type N-terminal cleavage/methylation domain-containing protein
MSLEVRGDEADSGLSLIELIVVVVITGIVLGAVATIFVNSWRTQEEVLRVSEATNRGQLVTSAVERAVRNAVAVDVVSAGGGTALRVKTTLGGSLGCQGFFLVDGGSHWTTSAGALSATPADWPEWTDGVEQQGATPFFTLTAEGAVEYAFDVETESAPVRFNGEVSPRSLAEGSSPCW